MWVKMMKITHISNLAKCPNCTGTKHIFLQCKGKIIYQKLRGYYRKASLNQEKNNTTEFPIIIHKSNLDKVNVSVTLFILIYSLKFSKHLQKKSHINAVAG